ncbi:Uncharacterized conserved protein [Janthinobacterium sp. Marseille]|nr:Uncharacterized conserved protein [Janthinobacterium sp. Marseille]
MKKNYLGVLAFGMALLLAGCGIGLGLAPRSSYDTYHPKPYRDYWIKSSMTEEGRKVDWIACGGDADGGTSMHVQKMLSNETKETSRLRQTSELKACLSQRGYRYESD